MRQVVLAALVLALILPVSASAAGYSSAGGDLELRASGSTVELVRDGHVVASDTAGADWVIQGADGVADTLTVRNPDGGIIPGHISFDGGDGDGVDTLKLSGGRADTGAALYAGPDSGSFHYERGTDELTVAYAGLEPIDDDVALANYTINGTAGDDIITIDDGAPGDGRLRVSIAGHEEVNFKNKTNVLIDAGAGGDTIFFINTETAAGLTGDLTANTGTELNESIRVGTANYTGGGLILETTGQIVDLNSANTNNVTGDRLGIQAGFGTLQLDSTVSNLEADLASGTVIRLINSGNVTVGGVSATLHGLRIGGDASGGDGSIDFRNTGDVTLSDATGPETVRSGFGIGGVGISVTGTLSTTAGQDAIRAPTGSVGITAGGYAIAAGSEIVSAAETGVQTGSGAFDLGGSGSGPALSDAELDEITASSLRVTGPTIASTAPVSLAPAKVPLLLLVSLGGISQTGSGGISAQSLNLQATSGVVALTSALNDVDSVTGVARSLDFADLDDITIGTTPSNGVESTGPGFVVTRVTAAGDVTVNGRVKSADLAAVLTQGAGHLIDNNNLITGNRARLAADRMTLADGNVLVSTFGNTIAVEGGLGSSPGVNLGSATDAAPNTIELSDAELNTMTGFALRVGTASGGSIAISAPITLDPPKLRGLFLISGGAVTQSAGVVAALLRTASAGATTLGSPANDVDNLAGTTSGAGSAFTYNDADGVAVSAVDGQSGVATSDGDVSITTASGGNLDITQTLKAGGSRLMKLQVGGDGSDLSGGHVESQRLELLGKNYVLQSAFNSVATLASSTSGGVLLSQVPALTIGSAGGTDGMTTPGGAVSVLGLGGLTVQKAVQASGVVTLLAAGDATLTNNAAIAGSRARLGAGSMALAGAGATVNVGTDEVKLIANSVSNSVKLGPTTDSGTTLDLSDAELDTITAGHVLIGPDVVSSITFTDAITPAHFNELDAWTDVAGAAIVDSHPGLDVTVPRLSLRGQGGIGSSDPLDTQVSTIQLDSGSGDIDVQNQGDLTIDGGGFCCATVGARTTTSGNVRIASNGNLTVASPVSAAAGRVILEAQGSDHTLLNNSSIAATTNSTLSADRMALGGGTVGIASPDAMTLRGHSAGRPVDLGSAGDPAGTLSLSDAELDTVTGKLVVGAPDGGLVSVSSAVGPAHAPSLSLLGAGGFAGPGSIAAPDLAFTDVSSTGRTWAVDKDAVSDGHGAVPYSGAAALAVNGGSGADTLGVKASPDTKITVTGGAPAGAPGDTFAYINEGRSFSGDLSAPDGEVTSPGVQPVAFGGFEAARFDVDADGAPDGADNCVNVVNPGQEDQDGDGVGDACEVDVDGDGQNDPADNCPSVANSDQLDRDHDGIGHACDPVDLAPGSCQNGLSGTSGPDVLNGTEAGDVIGGGAGNDVIRALAGDDCPSGDAGDDRLFGGAGADRMRGGAGDDHLSGGSGDDRFMRGGAGRDTMSGGAGADGLAGGTGNDALTGGDGGDYLSGGRGADKISGGGGANSLFGRAGDDRLNAANGVRETVSCGTGDDVAVVDRRDVVLGCEKVTRRPR